MTAQPDRRRRGGFTLIEVVVSLAMLAGALFSIAQLVVVACRVAESSRATTLATILASQKLEQLRSAAWGYDADGRLVRGSDPSPPNALTDNVDGFVDFVDGRGAPVGGGSTPPPGAEFVRRWAIEVAGSAGPDTVLVFRVVVLGCGASSLRAGTGRCPWLELARVVSSRSRRPS